MAEKVIDDLKDHITNLEELKIWLDKVYYDSDFSNMFDRRVLTLMAAGTNYLVINLTLMKDKQINRKDL